MHLLSGYAKPIIALAVTPDGTRLFSAALDQQMIWEWDLGAHKVIRKLRSQHRRGVEVLAMSPRGDCFVSASTYSTPTIWPLGEGEPRLLSECLWPAVAIDRAGRLLASSCFKYVGNTAQRHVRLWSLPDGKPVGQIATEADSITALAFSPDGTLLAVARYSTVRLWDLQTRLCRFALQHRIDANEVAFRPDGKVLASAGARSVFIWELAHGELRGTLKDHQGNVKGLAYSPDGKYLASVGLDGVVVLRDSQTHEVVGQRDLDIGKLGALCWRADSAALFVGGKMLIAQCGVEELLGQKQVKSRPRGEPLSLSGHVRKVTALCYSRDGRMLASGSKRQLNIWDLSGGAGQARLKHAFQPHMYGDVDLLSWSPDGKRLALAGRVVARIIDAETGGVVRGFDMAEEFPRHLSFTPAGRQLLVTVANTLHQPLRVSLTEPGMDVPRFEVMVPLQTHYHYCAFSHAAAVFGDDERIYLGLGTTTVSRWEPATRKVEPLMRQNALVSGLSVSADERTLVTGGGNSALVWDLPGGQKRLELKHPLSISGVACVPGGRVLTSCYDGLVRLWDLSGGTELYAFDLGMGKVYSLAVSPDHMTFAAGVEKKSRIVLMDLPE
jgi:WD40 repeat protein